MRPNLLMLGRLGKLLRIGDAVIVLNSFPATIKDFAEHEGELGAVVQRSAGKSGFVYYEEIERSKPAKTLSTKNSAFSPSEKEAVHDEEIYGNQSYYQTGSPS